MTGKLNSSIEHRLLASVIMAAGQGKRMQDPTLPKVLYPVGGEPMLGHVVRLCEELCAFPIICIIGYGRDAVSTYLSEKFPEAKIAIQEEQLGTGHAVQQAERELDGFAGDILILSGDVPLLTHETAARLIAHHRECKEAATVLTVHMDNPTGYGRVIRTESGRLKTIVEERDATPEERKIEEINTGIYVFNSDILFDVLKRIDRKNAQGEYYLTDTFKLIIEQFGMDAVAVVSTNDPIEVSGVNTKEQLATLEAEFERRAGVPSRVVTS
jgi:UDP-N-acetylglucosamine diphosphorylase/glucosamine-1-phosphate N-acetyltransferase